MKAKNTDPGNYINYDGIDYRIRERFTRSGGDTVYLRLLDEFQPSMRSRDKTIREDEAEEPRYHIKKVKSNMTEEESYKYFEFLIEHTVCELEDMLKTEKDPEKKAIIEETIEEANARNLVCANKVYSELELAELGYQVEDWRGGGDKTIATNIIDKSYINIQYLGEDKYRVLENIKADEENEQNIKNEDKDKDIEYWKDLALRDNLTQLYNRNAFDLVVEDLDDESLYFAIIDVDHFKDVNDTYGHDVGDEVLKALGGMLDKETIAFRWGGEEFILLLPADDSVTAEVFLDELREKVKTLEFENGFNISVSIGFTGYEETESTEEVFKEADKALYCAKEGGRDMVVEYEEGMDCEAHTDDGKDLTKNEECETCDDETPKEIESRKKN